MRVQGHDRRAKASFGHHFCLWIVLLDRGVVRVDLGLRFGDGRSGL